MNQKRLSEFINNFLVNASQMAYIEEAHGTFKLLQDFNELYRYLSRDLELVTLYNELSILKRYIEIQKVRYGDRIDIHIMNDNQHKAVFIGHLSVINFIDSLLYEALDKCETPIYINTEFETGNVTCLIVTMKSCEYEAKFTKVL